ncbi:MAG: hypothetical protein CMH83_17260 [Nocardioides sp.]|nr:hypothetical protein [Nocardioides sp.]
MDVRTPSGEHWQAHVRRWAWRPRFPAAMAGPETDRTPDDRFDRVAAYGGGLVGKPGGAVLKIPAAVFALLERLVLLALLPFTVLARALGGSHPVELRHEGRLYREEKVSGRAAADARVEELLDLLGHGGEPPARTHGTEYGAALPWFAGGDAH